MGLRCYRSNGQSHSEYDNGISKECAPVHGATTRHCVKFMTGGWFELELLLVPELI